MQTISQEREHRRFLRSQPIEAIADRSLRPSAELKRQLRDYLVAGPYKDLADTNPRRPLRKPANLYGVSLADGEYGTEYTDRSKEAK